jgi:hypothetical protein
MKWVAIHLPHTTHEDKGLHTVKKYAWQHKLEHDNAHIKTIKVFVKIHHTSSVGII